MGALVNKRRRKRDKSETEANTPPKVLRTDHASVRLKSMTRGGKSLAAMGLGANTPSHTPVQQSVSDPDPLSYARPSSKGATVQEIQILRSIPPRVHPLLGRQAVTGEEQIKAAFEEFKKREDDKVEKRCAKMDTRLDALIIDFDEELYPHMLISITSRRWVIGHARARSPAEGMNEGLKHGVEHGKAQLDLEAIEVYDPEADAKYVAALHALKDLKYPLIDQLEKLKDAPIDLIMASLYLESDVGEDTPQWIRELRPSSSQLKIPVYPEVRDPRDPWAFKEEMLLEDAIMANVSRAEKKKKCRVVCRTHGIGSAHHPRSDGIPVSVPTVAPQGLAILLTDAATQTETTEDEASPRLIRSKSLPPMYNLDWP
ncbi:hypothetical protein Tco_0168350 [Tanacetum coccineum]